MKTPRPYVSVVIATKDRSKELGTISLPSLAKQETLDFETIIWDASDDESSHQVVEAFATAHPDLTIRYYRAPRPGGCAQRNDAVKEARGEIIFFIDDDSEVSSDGLAALEEMFTRHEKLAGGCLPINYFQVRAISGQSVGCGNRLRTVYRTVFDPLFAGSGVFAASLPDQPNRLDQLPGCDMAYRREVFRDHSFNERLQRYAGYTLWEDIEFSHKLYLQGSLLHVAEKGSVVHRAASGQRTGSSFNRGRVEGYNSCVVWIEGILPFSRWSAIPFVWARIGFLGVVLLQCFLRPWQIARWKRTSGYLTGLCAFMLEKIREHDLDETDCASL